MLAEADSVVARRTCTVPEWAAALGAAMLVHLALAGFVLSLAPPEASEGGGRLAIGSLASARWRAVAVTDVQSQSAGEPHRPVPLASATPLTDVGPPAAQAAQAAAPRSATRATEPSRREPSGAAQSSAAQQARAHAAQRRPPGSPGASTTPSRQGSDGAAAGSGVDREAIPLQSNPSPGYPRLARRRGEEGRVLIRVAIRADGRVERVSIARSSDHKLLDRAALDAVRQWRFRPALRAGRAVTATLTVPVVFRLRG